MGLFTVGLLLVPLLISAGAVSSSPKVTLPPKYDGPAHLVIDGQNAFVGKIFATGSWTGDKQTSAAVRAEFAAMDAFVAKLRTAETIEIRADVAAWTDLRLPSPTVVTKAIETCATEATGPRSDRFLGGRHRGCV